MLLHDAMSTTTSSKRSLVAARRDLQTVVQDFIADTHNIRSIGFSGVDKDLRAAVVIWVCTSGASPAARENSVEPKARTKCSLR